MNKKGISPLIATVLILGFTVALAAVIMTWGQSFTKNIQKQTEETSQTQIRCATDVSFSIKDACFEAAKTSIKVTISNEGSTDIDKFKIRTYKSPSDVATGETTVKLLAFGVDSLIVSGLTGTDTIKKVEVFPIITTGGKTITCSSNVDSFGDENNINPIKACT